RRRACEPERPRRPDLERDLQPRWKAGPHRVRRPHRSHLERRERRRDRCPERPYALRQQRSIQPRWKSGDHSISRRGTDMGFQKGKEVLLLKGHSSSVLSAVFSADGRRIATASADNTARIWDFESGQEVAVLRGHTSEVRSVALT